MTAIEQLLRAHLGADTGIASLVGTRIYPEVAPQGAAYPFLTYQAINDKEHLVKPSIETFRIKTKRIQVDAYTRGNGGYAAIKTLEGLIKRAAYAFDRTVHSSVIETRVVSAEDDHDMVEGIYRVSMDVSILFNE